MWDCLALSRPTIGLRNGCCSLRESWSINADYTCGTRRRLPYRELTISDIPTIIAPALVRSFTPENIASAFRTTGIYPFCRETLLAKVHKDVAQSEIFPDAHSGSAQGAAEEHEEPAEDANVVQFSLWEEDDRDQQWGEDEETCPRQKKTRGKFPYCGVLRLQDHIKLVEIKKMEKEDALAASTRRRIAKEEAKKNKPTRRRKRLAEKLEDTSEVHGALKVVIRLRKREAHSGDGNQRRKRSRGSTQKGEGR